MDVTSREGGIADSSVAAFTRSRAAFDLKGVMASLTVLRLRSRDLNLIERQLRAKVMQFPQFFQAAPVVLDVGELEGGIEGFPLAALVRALSVSKIVPVAVTNLDEAHRGMATAAGLGIVNLSASRPAGDPEAPGEGRVLEARETHPPTPMPTAATPPPVRPAMFQAQDQRAQPRTPTPVASPAHGQAPPPVAQAAPPPPPPPAAVVARNGAHRAPMVVRQPVRSGQLIYAEKNDLIVLAPVNPGGQIVADGNIHVYAPLRGRAVAGAQGYTEARIFCQRFEAELVAIAGAILTFDDIPRDRLGKPVQVFVQNGVCAIAPL